MSWAEKRIYQRMHLLKHKKLGKILPNKSRLALMWPVPNANPNSEDCLLDLAVLYQGNFSIHHTVIIGATKLLGLPCLP